MVIFVEFNNRRALRVVVVFCFLPYWAADYQTWRKIRQYFSRTMNWENFMNGEVEILGENFYC